MRNLLDDHHIWEMAGSFEFYRDFHNEEQASQFADLLTQNRIPFRIEKNRTLLDAAIVGHGLVPPILIKIRSIDFRKVNDLLEKEVLRNPAYIASHYLQQLNDTELIDIVRNPNEWTVEDTAVAHRILNDRGIPIPREHVAEFNQQKNEALRKGRRGKPVWMVFYFLCILTGGILVSPLILLAGIGMGWYYWTDKTVDNQGVKFYSFDPGTRFFGKLIFYLGWFFLVLGGLLVYRTSLNTTLSFGKSMQHFPLRSVFHSATLPEQTKQVTGNFNSGCCFHQNPPSYYGLT